QLIGPDGLVPSRLIEVIRANEPTHELPDDKEIVILTKMTFDLSDRSAALEILRAAAPEFTSEGTDESGVEWFDWSREYPRNHWSPFRLLGGRQSLGSVRIAQDTLIAEARTLTMAAMLVAKLKTRLTEKIRLRDTVWRGADELLAELQDDLDEDSDD
ncbi:MAG TPA: hypothetical protein VNL70_01850, partial [Tepidisphaeraceae bacterium]|nr:hypothetical protein [Tepidisphaeraceae bacterium]